jgi:hypothetical protein
MRTSARKGVPSRRRAAHSQRAAELLDALGSIQAQGRFVAVDEALIVERAHGDGRGGSFEQRSVKLLGVRVGARRALARVESSLEIRNLRLELLLAHSAPE